MTLALAMKKVLPNRGTDPEHFLSAFATDLIMTQAIAYNGDLTEYIGYALPGTDKAEGKWLIKKLSYSGTKVTDIQFANGVIQWDQIWNDRAGLSYS